MAVRATWRGAIVWLGLATVLIAGVTGASADMLEKMRAKALESALKQLDSRKADTRMEAAKTLSGYEEPRAVAALAAALGDGDARVREAAASALWKIGDAAAAARPALEQALSDPAPAVRLRVAGALEALGADPATLVEARRGVAADGTWFDQALAVRDLIGSVPPAELVAPLLASLRATPAARRELFDDWDDSFSGASVVGRLAATDDPQAVAGLAAALAEDGMPRRALVEGISRCEVVPEDWAETLVRLAGDRDPALRRTVAAALGRVAAKPGGGAGWPAATLALLDDLDLGVCAEAVRAYDAAGGDGHPGAAKLAALTRSSDADVQRAAVRALGGIGDAAEPYDPAAKRAVAAAAAPALLAVVGGGGDEDLRRDAIDSYIRLAVEPADAARELARIAGGDFPTGVRISAVRAIGPLGRAAEGALPVLERLESDPEVLISSAAGRSRDQIGHGTALGPGGPVEAAPAVASVSPAAAAAAREWLRTHDRRFEQDDFYRALTEADAEAVRAFLDAGMSASDAGTTGMPPLHHALMFACTYGQRPTRHEALAVVEALLAHGADPNALDEQGNPALMRAVGPCDAVVIRRLVEAGADVSARNATGAVPFTMALAFGDAEAVEALVAGGFRLSAVEAAPMLEWYPDDADKRRLIELASGR